MYHIVFAAAREITEKGIIPTCRYLYNNPAFEHPTRESVFVRELAPPSPPLSIRKIRFSSSAFQVESGFDFTEEKKLVQYFSVQEQQRKPRKQAQGVGVMP
jgi:hypothetical protein